MFPYISRTIHSYIFSGNGFMKTVHTNDHLDKTQLLSLHEDQGTLTK